MKAAAIYARVSSEQQKEENTIASQTAALHRVRAGTGIRRTREWVIEDEGFSGASLLRPGLERLRDLAAEGHIQAVLIHSPDRLSRKYAYQVLLTEEFARHGVETIFLKAPHSGTPEDQLMLQFQGMIAEYERAQILERSRRGKRHRAKAGEVSVLCGAPYGYRYIRKTRDAPARYEIDAAEAEVVRLVYDMYTVKGLSIGAIARLLSEMGLPTRHRRPLGAIGRMGDPAQPGVQRRGLLQQDAGRTEAEGDEAVPPVGAGGPWRKEQQSRAAA